VGEAGEEKQWNWGFEQCGWGLQQMVAAAPDLIRTRPVALWVVQDVAGVLWHEEDVACAVCMMMLQRVQFLLY